MHVYIVLCFAAIRRKKDICRPMCVLCVHAWIQELPLGGHPLLLLPTLPSVPLPFLSLPSPFLPFPSGPLDNLEVGPLKSSWGSGERCKLPQQGPGLRPKMDLVHSRAVRKPLVAIILSILKCMFYSRSISSAGVLIPPSQSCILYEII